MNGGISQSARVMDAVIADMSKAAPANTATAWRLRGASAIAHKLCDCDTRRNAEQAAMPSLSHKDTLLVLERHAGMRRAILTAYRVRQGAAVYQRNPDTGLSERVQPLKLDELFSLPVEAFEPVRPFDAFRDDPVGRDAQLVEARA